MPPYLGWDDAIEMIFDGGVPVQEADLAAWSLQAAEISLSPTCTLDVARRLITPLATPPAHHRTWSDTRRNGVPGEWPASVRPVPTPFAGSWLCVAALRSGQVFADPSPTIQKGQPSVPGERGARARRRLRVSRRVPAAGPGRRSVLARALPDWLKETGEGFVDLTGHHLDIRRGKLIVDSIRCRGLVEHRLRIDG